MTKRFIKSSQKPSVCFRVIASLYALFATSISFALLGVVGCPVAFAGTLFVDATNSNPVPPYSDWSTAATNIQDAIEAADVGDQILVTNGVYRFGGRSVDGIQSNRIALTKEVVVASVNGPAVTFIEGEMGVDGTSIIWGERLILFGPNSVRCAYVGSNSILTGFTLTNGFTVESGSGAGVWCEGSGVVSNCVLTGNSAFFQGGGAYGGKLYSCTLSNNSAIWGGGARLAKLWNCVCTSNFAFENGGAANNCEIFNCTISGNSAGEYAGGVWDCAVYNSIVFHNGEGGDYYTYSYGSFDYSCTFPQPTRGVGNISGDPRFGDLEAGNLRLQSNSPCLNAGTNTYVTSATDVDGRQRITDGTVDMGAYESQPGIPGEFIGWLQNYSLPADGTADTLDSDSDSLSNLQEWRAGTNPTDPHSALSLLPPLKVGSDLVLRWPTVTNRTYFLERSISVVGQPKYLRLADGLTGGEGYATYTDTNALSSEFLFYRIGVE